MERAAHTAQPRPRTFRRLCLGLGLGPFPRCRGGGGSASAVVSAMGGNEDNDRSSFSAEKMNQIMHNLDQMGWDDAGADDSGHHHGDTTPKGRAGSRFLSAESTQSARGFLSGRARVDSTARPMQFMQLDERDKGGSKKAMVRKRPFASFSEHGISEDKLRKRMESKIIESHTVERVRSDFTPHDRLSNQELSALDELVTRAHRLHVERDDAGAERIYTQVLEADPVNYDCLSYTIYRYIYTQVLEADPVNYDCLSNMAKIAYARGDLQRAHDLFERAIVVRHSLPPGSMYICMCTYKIAYARGDLTRAHDLFERAIVVRPQHDKTVYHLAVVLYDMKQQNRARALFQEVYIDISI